MLGPRTGGGLQTPIYVRIRNFEKNSYELPRSKIPDIGEYPSSRDALRGTNSMLFPVNFF